MTDSLTQPTNDAVIEAHFRSVLNLIAHDRRYTEGEFVDAARFIAQTAAEVLGCQRSSVWEYNQSSAQGASLSCIISYQSDEEVFTEGDVLTEHNAGSYLQAITQESLLIVNNADTDPRCRELREGYLPSKNVTALLDATYQFDTNLAGVLCCEHVGDAREWSPAEQHFAANMASLLTIAAERAYRKQTSQMLEEGEDRYWSLVRDLPVGLMIMVDLKVKYANYFAARLAGYERPEDMDGIPLNDIVPLAPPEELRDWEAGVMQGKTEQPATEYRLTLKGKPVTLEITSTPVNWLGERALQILIRDVTEAAYAQLRLRRSERLLSQAQRIAKLGSWVWDLKTNQVECSHELRNLVGIRRSNPLYAPLQSIAHPDDVPRLEAAHQQAIETQQSYQISYRVNTTAGLVWLEEIGVPELGPDQQVIRIHGTSRDITRQKFAEIEAQTTEERFSALGNSFPGGFIYCDLAERYVFINETYGKWFRINPDEFLGKTIKEMVGEEKYQEAESHIELVKTGSSFTFEGTPHFNHSGIDRIQITYAPDVNLQGEVRGFFALITDITEQRSTEQALRQSQKMEAMGQLTGGIAHDFNNILAILMGNLELATATASEPETQEYLSAALQGVERGVAITRKLLSFARSNTPGEKIVRVDEVIDELENIISQSAGGQIEISLESEPDLWNTEIDAGDFEDAIINLCINARDAMPGGGRLIIKTANRTLDETSIQIHPTLSPGDYVLISVTDTGTGMSTETRDRLFEPFFTTKPEGKGTGLGMSMVFGFVKRSKGQIVVYSAEGEGTTINIYLPRSASEHIQTSEQIDISELPNQRETILIVDDEEMVANVAANILRELGYQTEVALSSEEALRRVSEGTKIDLLLSDVVMPEDHNGFQLASEVTQIRPSIRVLLTSGFSKFKGIEPADEESRWLADNILTKPYNRQELATSVRKVLDGEI